jgi:hypothetical protein
MKKKDRKTILFPLLWLLTGGLLGLLIYWLDHKGSVGLGDAYLLTQPLALLFGILSIWILYKQLFWSKRDPYIREQDSFWPEALYTFISALALSLGHLVVLFFFVRDVAVAYWSVGLAFMVPFLFLKTFDFLQQIPLRDYQIKWFFSQKRINENEWNWSNEMWISFLVDESRERTGLMGRKAKFRILAPRNVPLGEVFRLAVREYNRQGRNVVVQDLGFEPENKGQFWWLFSLKFLWNRPHTWFPNLRYLDPNDTAQINALRPGDLVKVTRIATGKGAVVTEEIAVGQPIA